MFAIGENVSQVSVKDQHTGSRNVLRKGSILLFPLLDLLLRQFADRNIGDNTLAVYNIAVSVLDQTPAVPDPAYRAVGGNNTVFVLDVLSGIGRVYCLIENPGPIVFVDHAQPYIPVVEPVLQRVSELSEPRAYVKGCVRGIRADCVEHHRQVFDETAVLVVGRRIFIGVRNFE